MAKTHGFARRDANGRKDPTYRAWIAMRARCARGPEWARFTDYGGRGITVCDRWRFFEAFLADMGKKPSAAHTVERKDNAKGYEPSNCIWADKQAQANNRRSNKRVAFHGVEYTQAELCRHVGISQSMFRHRLRKGWSVEKAATTPAHRGLKNEAGHFSPLQQSDCS